MKKKSLSIIVPCWKLSHKPFWGHVINSIMKTRAEEIILINNSPRDPLNKRLNQIPNIKVLEPGRNIGAAAAWNRGFEESSKDIVLFSADDIILRPKSLWKAVNMITKDVSFVYGDYGIVRYLNGNLKFVGEHKARPLDIDLFEGIYSGFVSNYIDGASPMRRDIFPGFDVSLPRFLDWDLWTRIVKAGHIGFYLPEKIFDTIDHPERGITRDSNPPLRALRKIRAKWNVRFTLTDKQKREIELIKTLLRLYHNRKDLQRSFPEVLKGDFQMLLTWAQNLTQYPKQKAGDLAYIQLKPYTKLLARAQLERELSNIKDEKETLTKELVTTRKEAIELQNELFYRYQYIKELETELSDLNGQIRKLLKEKSDANDRIGVLENELTNQRNEAARLRNELNAIISSKMYRIMKKTCNTIDFFLRK